MLTNKKEAQARQAYKPVQVKVTKVTPQGILCQSGEVLEAVPIEQYVGSPY